MDFDKLKNEVDRIIKRELACLGKNGATELGKNRVIGMVLLADDLGLLTSEEYLYFRREIKEMPTHSLADTPTAEKSKEREPTEAQERNMAQRKARHKK